MGKNVQIPEELWNYIVLYFTADARVPIIESRIVKGIKEKQAAQKRRELYQTYKNNPAAEQREKARQAYLDEKGVPKDFRW